MAPKQSAVAAFLTAALFLVAATAASAEDKHWNGVGWYLIVDVVDLGLIVLGGPVDEASCKAKLPPSDNETKYYCEYLTERPDWDL
ncbi:MAG: hypothetical protein KBA31_18240 [Alphaproteobacteria bacterium]|nr:hypothetical protein [Alphaproteobacteria bacterium]